MSLTAPAATTGSPHHAAGEPGRLEGQDERGASRAGCPKRAGQRADGSGPPQREPQLGHHRAAPALSPADYQRARPATTPPAQKTFAYPGRWAGWSPPRLLNGRSAGVNARTADISNPEREFDSRHPLHDLVMSPDIEDTEPHGAASRRVSSLRDGLLPPSTGPGRTTSPGRGQPPGVMGTTQMPRGAERAGTTAWRGSALVRSATPTGLLVPPSIGSASSQPPHDGLHHVGDYQISGGSAAWRSGPRPLVIPVAAAAGAITFLFALAACRRCWATWAYVTGMSWVSGHCCATENPPQYSETRGNGGWRRPR